MSDAILPVTTRALELSALFRAIGSLIDASDVRDNSDPLASAFDLSRLGVERVDALLAELYAAGMVGMRVHRTDLPTRGPQAPASSEPLMNPEA